MRVKNPAYRDRPEAKIARYSQLIESVINEVGSEREYVSFDDIRAAVATVDGGVNAELVTLLTDGSLHQLLIEMGYQVVS